MTEAGANQWKVFKENKERGETRERRRIERGGEGRRGGRGRERDSIIENEEKGCTQVSVLQGQDVTQVYPIDTNVSVALSI